jgi:xylulose-5-phosphate/fructose-6-phosphate phosphoketolase
MMLLNGTSRFDVAIQAVKGATRRNDRVRLQLHEVVSGLDELIKKTRKFVVDEKTDMPLPPCA